MRIVWRALRAFRLLLFFLKELLISNLQVARYVLIPMDRLQPAIVEIPLDIQSDTEILLLANLITLTPGTLSLDVAPDHRSIFVHVIHTKDPEGTITNIKTGFEARIRKVFQ